MRRHPKALSAGTTVGTGNSRVRFGIALAICALAALAAPSVGAAEVKAKLGGFGAPSDAAAGHLQTPRGVAVNTSGNGGVAKGTVYVVDATRNRIQQFSTPPTGGGATFVRTWGFGVASGGAEGTATLTAGSAEVTSVVTTKRAFREGQIVTGAGIPAGTVVKTVTTGVGAASKLILSNAATASASGVTLTAVESASNVLTNEKQTITVPGTASGSFTLKFKTLVPTVESPPSASIAVGAPASGAGSVQEALEGLANIGAGNVAVTGAAGGPYTVEFKGSLSDTNVEQILAGTQPTGATLSFATIQDGATVYEICTANCIAGIASTAAGGFSNGNASGIAVDQATGYVYVVSQAGRRVDVFSSEGVFAGAFGWAVKTGDTAASGPDFCTTATGCIAGAAAGAAAGQFSGTLTGTNPAFDPSAPPGTVYISDRGNKRIAKYSVTITAGMITAVSFLKAFGWDVASAGDSGDTAPTNQFEVCTTVCKEGVAGAGQGQFVEPSGIAIDGSGALYVASGKSPSNGNCELASPCRVQKFNTPVAAGGAIEDFAPGQLKFTSGAANGIAAYNVATDPASDHVFVAKKESAGTYKVLEFDKFGAPIDASPAVALPTVSANTTNSGLAVGTSERLYVDNSDLVVNTEVFVLGPVPLPAAEILPVSEVGQTTAKLNGKVTVPSPGSVPPDESFKTTYHFEYSADNGFHWASVPVPEASVGSTAGTFAISQTVSGLQPNLGYLVRLVARTGSSVTSSEEHFTTLAAKPSISGTIALPVKGTTATLTGAVNPNNSSTTYRFEWGTTTAYGNQAPGFEPFVGSGGHPIAVQADIGGLQLATTYHFRLVAGNASGTTFGPDASFTTNPWDFLNSDGLPDDRAFELVSPADKRPVGQVGNEVATQLLYQSSGDGNKVFYSMKSGLADSTAGGDLKYIAERTSSGWQSRQETPPSLVPPPRAARTGNVYFESPMLSCGIVESFEPLTADTPPKDIELGVTNLYRRNDDGTYTLLTNTVPLNPSFQPGAPIFYRLRGTTPDCSHVVFETQYQFPVSGSPSTGSDLYEWDGSTLRLAGVRPDGSAVAADAGGTSSGRPARVNALTTDDEGSKLLFFTATSNAGGDSGNRALFLRKVGAITTVVDVSQAQSGPKDNKGANYQMASADGGHVFFTANRGLTPQSSGGPESCTPFSWGDIQDGKGCDLYDYNVKTEQLVDLSVDNTDTNGASVAGILDVSDDGTYVYFAARGQLIPEKGNTETQNLAGNGFYNIYLSKPGGLQFVGLIAENTPSSLDADRAFATDLRTWTSDATPDGKHLLFISSANVTGYQGGALEAYVYSADNGGQVICISCRRDGLPSVAGPSVNPITVKSGIISPPGRPSVEDEIIEKRPRAISDDGSRVFFTIADPLASEAVSGNVNIYEWEKGANYLLATGSGLAAPIYIDSSPSGSDVFISTPQQLVTQDFDFSTDLYDLRAPHVAGEAVGFPAPLPQAPPCEPLAGGCETPATPQPPPTGALPSEAATGVGNEAIGKPRKPHHRKHRKHKRGKRAGQHRHVHRKGRDSR